MITCYLRYEVDPDKLADFEAYGAMWLDLVPRFGGIHHGYFLPSEGHSDIALAMFSFPSLAAYEQYRKDAGADPDVQKAVAFAKETRCFVRYERSFFRHCFRKQHRADRGKSVRPFFPKRFRQLPPLNLPSRQLA